MNRKIVIAVMLSLALVYFAGCKKKEQQPVPKAPTMPPAMGALPQEQAPQQGRQMTTGGKVQVVVPDSVKGKWNSVKLLIEEKDSKKVQEYTVNLNSEWKIPGSNLKVAVGDFLPDFRMEGDKITSASSEMNNPAVGVKITEGGKQIFPAPGKQWGWLWSRKELQSMHPFEHPKYKIMFKEPVKKG